ncbi:MAG TPA: ABC transporter permease [Thermoanaerobaculia bacterium]|nr:ABC transporter permease [Thermoanaerobaculia bacterium]HUM30677.1 ABC transporter permease [Thermoanaerobaculia bacterium]HXK68915.1 ABC transporter permease [Thermoanaerobaculia bacterium]
MNSAIDISTLNLALSYLLLILPLGIFLWFKVPILGDTAIAILRMTVQLLFVGFYLDVVFTLDHALLNGAWIFIMIVVADLSILRGSRLSLRRYAVPIFLSLVVGTCLPLFTFMGPVLARPSLMEARYLIPLGGMILGNCLRADIIGIRHFFESLQKGERTYLLTLSQGARLSEALRPYLRDALQAALAPTVATMATIGLVSLPGMMTGVILGGTDPMVAIKYQIAIMIAIFTGTALTVFLALLLARPKAFTPYGTLDPDALR